MQILAPMRIRIRHDQENATRNISPEKGFLCLQIYLYIRPDIRPVIRSGRIPDIRTDIWQSISGILPDTGYQKKAGYPARYPASRISGISLLIRVGHPFMNGNERTVEKNERNWTIVLFRSFPFFSVHSVHLVGTEERSTVYPERRNGAGWNGFNGGNERAGTDWNGTERISVLFRSSPFFFRSFQ